MPSTMTFDMLKSDVLAHAKTLTVLVEDLREIKDIVEQLMIDKAVKAEADRHLDQRLKRIEDSILAQTVRFDMQFKSIYKLGLWALGIFGIGMLTAFGNFVMRGGLFLVGATQ